MNLPPGLPPLPPVPEGFDRWEYRGIGWEKSEVPAFASTWVNPPTKKQAQWWEERDEDANGYDDTHYIEAVRDQPESCSECVQGYVQETGFDRCEKCNPAASGVESRVCEDIAARQRLGIAKYGQTVEQSPDDMLQHAYEEALDLAVYLKAQIERTGWRPIERAARDLLSAAQLVRSVVLVSFQQGQHPRTTMDFGRFQTAIENLEAVLSPPAERSDHE